MDPIIIIGSGLAGYTLAKEFRKLDNTTPLIVVTASDGRFYSKPLLSTALTKQHHPTSLAIAPAATMMKQLNAEIFPKTRVTKIDAQHKRITISERQLSYSKLVLACGADPIRPPLTGNAVAEVRSVNDLEDYALFRDSLADKKHLLILGAGLVGCEFANDLLNVGYQISIVALGHYPLETLLPEPIGQALQYALSSKGAQWHFQKYVKQVDHRNNHFLVTLSDQTTLEADLVLSAIGLRPHTELAQTAGLKINRGIVVDRTLQSSEKHIYALGDCAEVNGLVQLFVAPLLECARTLAKTLAGQETMIHYPPMPVVVKTPALPLVILTPPPDCMGQWEVSGEQHDLKAVFYDQQKKLQGFALAGKFVTEKMALTKEVEEGR